MAIRCIGQVRRYIWPGLRCWITYPGWTTSFIIVILNSSMQVTFTAVLGQWKHLIIRTARLHINPIFEPGDGSKHSWTVLQTWDFINHWGTLRILSHTVLTYNCYAFSQVLYFNKILSYLSISIFCYFKLLHCYIWHNITVLLHTTFDSDYK